MKQQHAFDRPIITPDLQPSLRAAFDIVREFGSLAAALERVERADLGAMASIIRIASTDPRGVSNFLHNINTYGLKHLPLIRPVFIRFFQDLIENPLGEDEPKSKENQPAKPQPELTPLQYYKRMFQIGTGVLGWTPEQTWNATLAEITMAYQGRTEFVSDILKSIFGSPEKHESAVTQYSDDEYNQILKDGKDPNFDRSALDNLRQSL